MDIYRKQFGKKLAKALSDANLTQSGLADLLNVEGSTVSRWVTGRDFPREKHLNEICKKLGKDLSYFAPDGAAEPNISKLTTDDAVALFDQILSLQKVSRRKRGLILALVSSDSSYLESMTQQDRLHAQALLKVL